jgi:hypothetical protein
MKVTAETAHKVCGHGIFLLLFEGRITGLYVSFLRPYDLSYRLAYPYHGQFCADDVDLWRTRAQNFIYELLNMIGNFQVGVTVG